MFQFGLYFADGFHHFVHFFGSSVAHFFVQLQHFGFHLVHAVKSGAQHFADSHALLQRALLVKVAHCYFAGPFHFAFIRQGMAGNNV